MASEPKHYSDAKPPFAEWVILELLGHRRLAGFLTEQEIAGHGFLRLAIPGVQPVTQFYNPASVYGITPTTEFVARAVADTSRPMPVQRWELELLADPADEDQAAEARAAARAAGEFDGPF